MSARTGMSDLIQRLRGMTATGTADYTIGVAYWSDDQLQDVLDRNRQDVYKMPMMREPEYLNGTAQWHNYYFGETSVEQSASGTVAWKIENSAGSAIGTADYTPYYNAGYVRFTADQGGTAYFLTFRIYDLERSAADVWEQKAAHVADRFDIKTDNHDLKRSQLRASYLDMAKSWRRKAKPKLTRMTREDAY